MQTTSKPARRRPKFYLTLNVDNFDALCEASGIRTQKEIAAVVGMSVTTLWRIRCDDMLPSNEFIARVRKAFPAAPFSSLFSENA